MKSNCKTTIRNHAEKLNSAALVLLATSKQIRSSNLDHSQVFPILGSIKYQQPSIFLPQLFYVAFKRPPQHIWRSHCILYSGSLWAQLSVWCSNVSLFKSTGGLSVLDNADQEGEIPHCEVRWYSVMKQTASEHAHEHLSSLWTLQKQSNRPSGLNDTRKP